MSPSTFSSRGLGGRGDVSGADTGIEARGVSRTLGGRTVLEDVSLRAHEGQFVGLLGPNGSGKSSLLRSVYLGLRLDAGVITLEGRDNRELTHRQRAKRVASVLQERPSEIELTVRESVALGREPHTGSFGRLTHEDHRTVDESMEQVNVAHLADRSVNDLSGGERQRVLVARALAQRSPTLLLDEPTNHLDLRHQIELMQLLKSLPQTVLAALHDLNLAMQFCDVVYILRDGVVEASGEPARVLTPELIRHVYGVEARLLPNGPELPPQIAFQPSLTTQHPRGAQS